MKQNRTYRIILRIWIGLVSAIVFLGGWIFLGNSGKPVFASPGSAATEAAGPAGDLQSLAPLPTLAPLPSLDNSQSSQTFQQAPQQNFEFSRPQLRTHGS